ncbi:glycosyltransferase involved in cell wall biosynthesis [Flavobacterium sp. HSC-32F16]|uniref:glycosyltransferase family 2 protein n=1 Tax=Flavobacterium sp. HSC-32F16 TaxID=2910964 RepID=UPI0020A33BD1|nr:glycosyltransferase family A protein [Flavobacterium sp. HSC-32F16]MCP2029173.1 glycosyltransferase involved in cell wall biosynthesis [Flavobacterium sp. HSC-32F16]
MQKPLVSVIITTYNRNNYLKKALESVLNQSYKNLDIIVVDDGSFGDENQNLCSKYSFVNYIKIENSGGPCKPRNEGIKISKGAYIAFLDDDDIWEYNKIEILLDVLESNPSFGLAHHYCKLIDENDKDLEKYVGRPGKLEDKHGNISMKMIGNYTVSDYPLCRTEIIKKVGFFNEKMIAAGEDVEYWNRASFFTKFYYVDLPLTKYRIHFSNNSEINRQEYLKLNIFNKYFLTEYKNRGIISETEFHIYIQKLVHNQIKMFKTNFLKSLIILNKLDSFWFMKWKSIKLFIFILIKR